MDIRRFDFELDEIVSLIPRLADLAQNIELEPRLHGLEEDVEVHSRRSVPTFRISCQLSGAEDSVSRLAELATGVGVEALVDFGTSVRLRHVRFAETAPSRGEKGQP